MCHFYSKQLKSPKWQRKRLAIMSRDNFACAWCLDADSTLHVHHLFYIGFRKPWEYADAFLVTLCEACHNLAHFTGAAHDLKAHIMERHGAGTITSDAVAHLFSEHNLGAL
jgi:5-methylcytosine-specific restriction endonuclease McrA